MALNACVSSVAPRSNAACAVLERRQSVWPMATTTPAADERLDGVEPAGQFGSDRDLAQGAAGGPSSSSATVAGSGMRSGSSGSCAPRCESAQERPLEVRSEHERVALGERRRSSARLAVRSATGLRHEAQHRAGRAVRAVHGEGGADAVGAVVEVDAPPAAVAVQVDEARGEPRGRRRRSRRRSVGG